MCPRVQLAPSARSGQDMFWACARERGLEGSGTQSVAENEQVSRRKRQTRKLPSCAAIPSVLSAPSHLRAGPAPDPIVAARLFSLSPFDLGDDKELGRSGEFQRITDAAD